MHVLNNGTHALVFPPRCGTRWIAEKLYHKGLIDTFGPHHDFTYEKTDAKIFMFVRNPFTRERSIHRWLVETSQVKLEELSFLQYIDSSWFKHELSFYDRYGDLNNLVEHVHLENINNFFKQELNIDVENYDNSYHQVDDGINDDEIFTDKTIVNKILNKYQEDIKHIDFDLTLYT